MTEELRKKARSLALDVFAQAVDSDDDSHCLDTALATELIAEAFASLSPSREAGNGNRALPYDRETLGRFVREAWVRWAEKQSSPKPSWLVPYDRLPEADKEADRQIGEAVARWTLIGDAASNSFTTPPASEADVSTLKAEVERMRKALERLSALTPIRANARTPHDLHLTVKAIADTALDNEDLGPEQPWIMPDDIDSAGDRP